MDASWRLTWVPFHQASYSGIELPYRGLDHVWCNNDIGNVSMRARSRLTPARSGVLKQTFATA
jgi:hypothetical protein